MNAIEWTDIIFKKLQGWLTLFIKMLPNLAIAFVVLAVGYFVSRLVRKFSYKLTHGVSHSDSVSGVVSVILQPLVLFPGHYLRPSGIEPRQGGLVLAGWSGSNRPGTRICFPGPEF